MYSGLALALIAVLVVNAFNSIRTRATVQRVLHLRKLLPSSASLSLKEHVNPFVDELMLVFEMTGLIIDTATPKFVGASVPLLTAQEHSHHSWHATAYKGREYGLWRWSWLDAFGRLVLLQSGPLSLASIGGVEAGTLPFFFLPVFLPFVRSSISSLFVFHGLEEIEHGALTGQCLTDKSYLFWRIVAWLGNIGFLCIHLLLPPVVRILWQPAVLLRPRCYGDLVLYYLQARSDVPHDGRNGVVDVVALCARPARVAARLLLCHGLYAQARPRARSQVRSGQDGYLRPEDVTWASYLQR